MEPFTQKGAISQVLSLDLDKWCPYVVRIRIKWFTIINPAGWMQILGLVTEYLYCPCNSPGTLT